eukprot:TRINITY_DN18962_c0_g1_i1.p1 TRINITY_DN18962_c0_g1~~TRINITY_DN18962_c0_g1_i1.p1  ORF type:complete len:174 (+),score=35.83 TRINITY_DN18962_c0_g1_i1:206-727(+)
MADDPEFQGAVNFLKEHGPEIQPSSEVQLKLYALYKQATEGPCSAKAPSRINIKEHEKWKAHTNLGEMPGEEAVGEYLRVVTKLVPDWREKVAQMDLPAEIPGSMPGHAWGDEDEAAVMPDAPLRPTEDESLDYILIPVAGVATVLAMYYWCRARKLASAVRHLSKFRMMSKL